MSASAARPPKYNLEVVEQVILEEAVELHPRLPTITDLVRRIVDDADDAKEVGTATQAIRGLRDAGLFQVRDDERVEPTSAALRACALLVG